MRRNATAHLGKIERDLRPTVIVTESDTVLLGDTEARRIKRAPKKFDDYDNTFKEIRSDSDNDEPPAKKFKSSNADINGDLSYKARAQPVLTEGYEKLKNIQREVRKLLHVRVDVQRMKELSNLEVWCMVHKLYKCFCKGLLPVERLNVAPLSPEKKQAEPFRNSMESKEPQLIPVVPTKIVPSNIPIVPKIVEKIKSLLEQELVKPNEVEKLVDDGFSRRVLPVDVASRKPSPKPHASAQFRSGDGIPKIEILNLCELINGGIGPIFINVYDDRSMRLNPIFRSVLNNRNAIIYLDGTGYFIDKNRVQVDELDFSSVFEELDHPIFIIQAKEDSPQPVSSTMNEDFVKILFKSDCEEVIQIRDKTALAELGEIIESILRNVRRKIESKIEGEPNDLVKEQLSMITRDRSKSTSTSSSVSSSHSPPLSFQGIKLTEAPPPGNKTSLMNEFNHIFSSRMQRLVGLIASNTLGLSPSNEMLNKFYIYQWHLMLQSFEEDLVQIWQVRLESEDGEGYQMLALTDSREVPEIEHAKKESIVNIRKLSMSDDITELTRLILLRVEKASMKHMTILLYGCKGYFRICGMLNSKDNYINGFVAKPTRATHPRIAAKINKIYHIWYRSREARIKRSVQNALNEQRMIALNGWIQEKNKKPKRDDFKKASRKLFAKSSVDLIIFFIPYRVKQTSNGFFSTSQTISRTFISKRGVVTYLTKSSWR